MTTVRYEHWSGAGNTFALIDASDAAHARIQTAELARRVCAAGRVARAGVDGLLLADGARVRLWNRDGSTARFCGNGARCFAARTLQRTGAERIDLRFGPYAIWGRREARGYTVSVPAPREIVPAPARAQFRDALAPIAANLAHVMLVQAGVPHLCLWLRRAPRRDLGSIAARLRRHPRLGAGGANVSLLWMRAGASRTPAVEIRTYERGVEGFTAACGSGAVAGAFLLFTLFGASRRGSASDAGAARKRAHRPRTRECARLRFASGAWLRVERNGPAWTLSGPARLLGEGVLAP